ncbi:MAG: alpha/beta hydrolase [Rhodospirillaceae bacterium]|jgi:pimeloyl-ACP methyl ester carboxylesterase|nr:alpha/beta hydrolase [Rhodospirillaceae bacterium]MBT3810132.1 alpha/beta hydrolase [Rhodospirillaceae bacterium]MBT3930233.1 alpha/beta hydrolase [Rhodospirillaceae bacterium]MBT5357555.1 alpha/beta hydrolase [Rhodospirillaceae bacterium]MBT5770544.1 alpha/beta hydrolase [Rhodospirillaceae bacterium]
MDLEYRPVSGAALALMREGHNHPDMVATLAEIVSDFGAGGVPPAPENTDGETEDIGGLEVTHRFVEAPGESESIRWHFVEAGEGPVLLLMHGIPQSWYMWQPILAELAKHFRCIAIDLKGYGQSDQGRGDYRHEGVAEQVVALLDVLDIDRFNLFSHDRGTVQADFVAAKHADRVIRWVRGSQHLIHFHPDLAPQELLFSDLETRGILQDPVKMFQWGYGRLCKHPIAKPGVVRAIQEFSRPGTGLAVERYFQSSTFRKDWIDRRTRLIPAWKAPMLILQGSDEPPMPVENYEGLEAYLPDAQVELVDGGHFYVEENPAGTLAKALPFLLAG